MAHYIDKDRIVAEIKKLDEFWHLSKSAEGQATVESLLSFLDTLEVKEDSLEKFKSLQHITGNMESTVEDWGYAPNLYYFDGSWHVDWISCEDGDSIYGFTAETPEDAIDKAYNWFHSTFCNG